MVHVPKKFTYLGIDETGMSLGNSSLVVCVAATENHVLAEDKGYHTLQKSKDILVAAEAYTRAGKIRPSKIPQFPPLDELRANGLSHFHWTRATPGRFRKKQVIEHASIAHVVASNGYNPQRTILLIDAFYGSGAKSAYFIHELLRAHGFNMPIKNIQFHGEGDRCIPIINYADLLGFQIMLSLNVQYRRWWHGAPTFPIAPQEIPYSEQRVFPPNERGRQILEEIIRAWSGR